MRILMLVQVHLKAELQELLSVIVAATSSVSAASAVLLNPSQSAAAATCNSVANDTSIKTTVQYLQQAIHELTAAVDSSRSTWQQLQDDAAALAKQLEAAQAEEHAASQAQIAVQQELAIAQQQAEAAQQMVADMKAELHMVSIPRIDRKADCSLLDFCAWPVCSAGLFCAARKQCKAPFVLNMGAPKILAAAAVHDLLMSNIL